MRNIFLRLLIAIVSINLFIIPALADLTGDVQGTVLDESGAGVPNAKVTIKNVGTGATRLVTTNQSGEYSAPQMEIGDYLVTVEKDGFKKFTQSIVVRSG